MRETEAGLNLQIVSLCRWGIVVWLSNNLCSAHII
jgi:hypothetical protein